MLTSAMAFVRRHTVMFGVVKFCAGLVIGFGLGIYFLPILKAAKGLASASILALSDSASVAANLSGICRGQMGCIGVMVIMVNADASGLMAKCVSLRSPESDPKYVETEPGLQAIKANQCK